MSLRYGPTGSARSRSRSGPWCCAVSQPGVLKFTPAQTLAGHSTSFFIDDTALNAS